MSRWRRFGPIWVAMAFILTGSQAYAITTDGDWSDWFTYHGNLASDDWEQGNYTLLDGHIRAQADEEGTTPGGGGQDYDIEEIFYVFRYTDNSNPSLGGTIHVGLVTGFDAAGRFGAGGPHYAGDMFFDFGATGGFDLAVAVGTEITPENLGGTRFSRAWVNLGAPNWTTLGVNTHYDSGPYRVDENAAGAVGYTGAVEVAWGGAGSHNFLEIALTVGGDVASLLTDPENGGLGLHWTMLCGNDVVDVMDENPLNPVPEPASIALLGIGFMGLALRSRFPQC